MDIRDAGTVLGPSFSFSGGDTETWLSRGAYLTFPIYFSVLELRYGACSSCGDEEYEIVSKVEYSRFLMIFKFEHSASEP
jgi:hypothetical protein